MKTVGELIRHHRERLGLTLAALAQRVGATKAYLSMIENHRVANPPSLPLLQALERTLQIEDGELVRAGEWQSTPQAVQREYQQIAEKAQQGLELAQWLMHSAGRRRDGAKNLDELFDSGRLAEMVNSTLAGSELVQRGIDAHVKLQRQVPLINKVAAGYPSGFTDLDYPAQVADEYVPCPEVNDPQAFAARVVGDSMLPDYHEGDIVIFSPAADVIDGSDCFVRIEPDHETTFKRVYFANGTIRLQPLNPRYAPHTLDREQVAGLYRAVMRIQPLA